jgi:hypothetical protein
MVLPHRGPHAAGAEPATAPDPIGGTVIKHELAVCNGEEVFIVAFNYDTAKQNQAILATKTWSWKARDREEIDKKFKTSFMMTSECKPVDGGRKMIVAAKEGGIALVDRESGKALFHVVMPNRGYSGDLLPENRIAIVSGDEKTGHVSVYDVKNAARPLFQQALTGARGIVWDAQRESLWAVGYSELRKYKLAFWKTPEASLKVEESFKLPQEDGHDLQLVPGKPELMLTTAKGLWRFDMTRQRFSPDQILGSRDEIKSVSVHPQSRLLAYVHEEGKTWWSQRVRLIGAENDLLFPNSKIYKARWVTSE